MRDYNYAGKVDDFQGDDWTLIQVDYDIEALRDHLGIDDEFSYYLVQVGDGEYLRVLGMVGIHLVDEVYEYVLD